MQRKTEPEIASTDTALGRCLVDGDAATNSRDRRRRRKALGISLAIEVVALTLLIVAPLITSVAQPHFATTSFVPLAFGGSHTPSEAQRPPSTTRRSEKFHSHPFTFTMNPTTQRPAPQAEEEDVLPISGGGPLGNSSPPEGILIAGFQPTEAVVHPPSEIKKSEEKHTVKVSEGVEQARLTSRIEPIYPFIAKQTRTQGTVLLRAIINRDGRIMALEVLSGPPLLVQAAVDAARQWRYRPTYLNGEPVEVDTSITVIFRLNQ